MLDLRTMKSNLKFLFLSILVIAGNFSFAQEENNVNSIVQWHHLDVNSSHMYGVSTDLAFSLLNNYDLKLRTLKVAVIDGDLDVNHLDLRRNVWNNPKKNRKGYKNDLHGWNFLGTSTGLQIQKTGTEAFRIYKSMRAKYEGMQVDQVKNAAERDSLLLFKQVKKEAKINSYIQFYEMNKLSMRAYQIADSMIVKHFAEYGQVRLDQVKDLRAADSLTQEYFDAAIRSSWKYPESSLWTQVYTAQKEEFDVLEKRVASLYDTSNPRDLIGDDLSNIKDKYYGNNNLIDSSSFHGTFVAGLIAADRKNGIGVAGFGDQIEIMGIRAVPDGDEFDKDIALAIRYAVDNGAQIINMSFGKYFATHPEWVNEAITYALKKNVLVIKAAGNDNKDLNTVLSYPQIPQVKNKKHDSFLVIGASDPQGKKAVFSNYGSQTVDFFAPGVDIYSTVTGGGYQKANGTSFAAPITAGAAAFIWSAFPKLKAYQIKDILIQSASKQQVADLNGMAKVGGILNLARAFEIAKNYAGK